MTQEEWSIDWLTDFAAEIKQARLEAFKASIELAHRAKTMGPGAVKAVSPFLGWTAQTVNRLAGLHPLLQDSPELIDPEVPLGIYWYLLKQYDNDLDYFKQWLRPCIRDGLSLAQLKELRGEKRERETQEPWLDGQAWGYVGRTGDKVITAFKPPSAPDAIYLSVRAVEVPDDTEE